MTTVVFDGEILATDSRVTMPKPRSIHAGGDPSCPACNEKLDKVHGHRNKLFIAKPNTRFHGETVLAFAGAGSAPTIHALSKAMDNNLELGKVWEVILTLNGNPHCQCRTGSARMIVVGEQSTWLIDTGVRSVTIDKVTEFPVAIGSGSRAALLGIKRMGFNAIGGLACAMDVDEGTGGRMNYVNCREETTPTKCQHYEWTQADTDELFAGALKPVKKPSSK